MRYLRVCRAASLIVALFVFADWVPTSGYAQQGSGCQLFPETGNTVCGIFLAYWETHGGLPQQGYPISNEFQERSDLNGQTYTVQYFERAVFEFHPENQPPYNVLLSQLGTFQYRAKYSLTPTSVPVQPTNTPVPATSTPTLIPTPSGPAVQGQPVPLAPGVVMILDHSGAPDDSDQQCGGSMDWGFTITNTSSAPYTIALNRQSVHQTDDRDFGNYGRSPEFCLQNGGFGGAFANPDSTTLAVNRSTTAYIRIYTGEITEPSLTYFSLSMRLSGTSTLRFRAPIPDALRGSSGP